MNATFSVCHFVSFIYFTIKLEGTARRWLTAVAPDQTTSLFFRCPCVHCLEKYIWCNELSGPINK